MTAESTHWLSGPAAESLLRDWESNVLDRHWQTLPFASGLPSNPGFALLGQYDSLAMVDFVAARTGHQPFEDHPANDTRAHRMTQEGLVQAMRWLQTPIIAGELEGRLSYKTLDDSGQFAMHASDYVDIADCHRAFGRGAFELEVDKENRVVRFVPRKSLSSHDPAVGIFEDALLSKKRGKQRYFENHDWPRYVHHLVGRLVPRPQDGRISFLRLDELFTDESLRVATMLRADDLRELSGKMRVGGISLDQVDFVWGVLCLWGLSAEVVFPAMVQRGVKQEDCLPTQIIDRAFAVDLFARNASQIGRDVIDAILSMLTFDTRLSPADIFLQPILRRDGAIAFSPRVVRYSRYRRNLLKLAAKTGRSDEVANIVGSLERPTVERAAKKLKKYGYQTREFVTLSLPAGDCEIDILAWCPSSPSEALIIEVKGCLPADEVNEVAKVDGEITAARKQLDRLVKIIRASDPLELSKRVPGVPWKQLQHLAGLVLLYEGAPAFAPTDERLPCIDLRVFLHLLRSSDFRTIRRLHSSAINRAWLADLFAAESTYDRRQIGSVSYDLPVATG